MKQAYSLGWKFTMAGNDPRFGCPFVNGSQKAYAWTHGSLDAMEAQEGESADPSAAGY